MIPAGSIAKYEVSAGKTARIMTGAMIPPGADAVVKYEDTRFTESEVSFVAPAETKNIVEVGEDVKKGICLISPGKIIGAADAAIMAGQGMSDVMVFRQPEIAVISTGSELAAQGQELPAGKIYNTNYYLLGGYIRKYGMIPKNYGIVQDDISILSDKIEEALKKTDMVITTGGVSAGDFDYIPEVMDRIDAKIVFHRLAFKPGGAPLGA